MSPDANPPAPPLFDRRVPNELIAQLGHGGVFEWVTELARSPLSAERPLDLGLRATPRAPGEGRATLYVGTTKVLDIDRHVDGRFTLTPWAQNGLFKDVQRPTGDGWKRRQPLDAFRATSDEVKAQVEAAIAGAPACRMREGLYQAALSKPNRLRVTLVDREVMMAFPTQIDEDGRKALLRTELESATSSIETEPWAASRGKHQPGDKLDALAIDHHGRLLAIEVKPGSSTTELPWTPVQVAMYVRLLRCWVDTDPAHAKEVLEGMIRQRSQIGLGGIAALREPIEIRPVIAVGGEVTSPHAAKRFRIVQRALEGAGEHLEGLAIWNITNTGEISDTGTSTL